MMIQAAECAPSTNFRYAGELIKHTRQRLGMSQKYVARKVNMSPSGLCKIESGKHMQPRKMFQISKLLNLNPEVFAEFEGTKPKEMNKTLDDFKQSFPNWKDLFKEILREGIGELI